VIKNYSLRLLETALNTALGLDEFVQRKLIAFDSKTILICLMPFQWHFFMRFASGRVVLMLESEDKPDTVIYSTPIGLIRLSILPASKARSLFHDGIRMEGDIQLGQQIKQVMDEIDIDWEGYLAHFTGDMVAYQLGSGFRRMKQAAQQVHNSLTFQMTAYLQEEVALLPSREAVYDFCEDVDKLVLDVERFEAKLKLGCLN
jgi:ubiquinone biosynthesis accessory factor UbiJ